MKPIISKKILKLPLIKTRITLHNLIARPDSHHLTRRQTAMSETALKKNRSRVNTANVNKKSRKTKKKGPINQKELDEMVHINLKNG